MKKNKQFQIGVIGPAGPQEYPKGKAPDPNTYALAEEVGRSLAKKNCIVVTGGKSGVMESAARGAKRAGGMTVGVVKGKIRGTSNPYIDVEVLSGMSADGFDEFLVVTMCDGLILLGGGAGTLEEITIAYRNKKPVVAIKGTGGWADKLAGTALDERSLSPIISAQTPRDAVEKLLRAIRAKNRVHHRTPS